ncbi:hypothetical protein DB346_06885 [Verrucomicrobia bacterium LW23]|nr:hypothetical protein DB346_06885 [Verrucomicrobia bacterium LW23]
MATPSPSHGHVEEHPHGELIPYIVKSRPDTGLYNGKLGIWLFLASEVMLFGGLFSAYIFLRLGAEHWPYHDVLQIWPGLVNTAVLIFSSITMVLSWAAVKRRKMGEYYMWMWITIGCAFIFLGIKTYEYYGKFTHYGVHIKHASFAKYKGALEHEHAKVKEWVSSASFEITGHIHGVDDPNKSYIEFVTDPDTGGHGHGHAAHPPAADAHAPAKGGGGAGGHGNAIKIERSDILRYGVFYPKYNTFFAIYFVITGLHALHIIGGICVLTFFALPIGSAAIYKENPEWLANRIETTGLFWHFVDLVWIFLFPVFYLL